MNTSHSALSAGKLLIAEPFLEDPNFERSVILLADYSAEGALGFVLNQPLHIPINDLTLNWPPLQAQAFQGGPVHKESLFFLHNQGDLLPGSVAVAPNVWWGGEVDALVNLLETGLITAADIRFFMGYSGWEKGQLHREIEEQAWVVSPLGNIDIFTQDPGTLWQTAVRNLQGDYRLWVNSPMDPQWN